MKPVISWPGGKSKLSPIILTLIPPHRTYCEVFGGGLAVFLAKPQSAVEIINDLDHDLVTFYRVARYHMQALREEIELVPVSRKEFSDFIQQPGLTDIQRSARWFIRNKTSFGGKMEHFGTSKTTPASSRANWLAGIEELNARMDRVRIENLDYRRLFDVYDSFETVFFLDPPYVKGEQYKVGAWKKQDHVELAERIRKLTGHFILTYDDHPLIHELYKGFRIQEVSHRLGINNRAGGKAKPFNQLIITPPIGT